MKTSKVFLLVILILSSSYLVYIRPVNATEDSWATKKPMPTARYRFGVAVVAGKIYAIGGLDSGPLGTNEEYDPATDTWTTKTSMPTPRYYFAVAVYENKIYTFGGLTETSLQNNTYVGVTEVYDPETDTWETKTSMPTNRSALCANVVNGKIYLISGIVYGPPLTFSFHSNVTEVYDPETDTWTSKASIPTPVCSYTSVVVDNKIYVISGSKQDTTCSNLNQVYDAETDTWTEAEPIPTGVRFAASGATTGALAPERIYVIGGSTTQFPDGSNLTQIYDPEKDAWSYGTPMLTPRADLRIAIVNDVLYAIGGFNTDGDNILPVNEQYTPAGYIPEFPSWTILPLLLVATLMVIICKKRLPKNPSNQQKSFIVGD